MSNTYYTISLPEIENLHSQIMKTISVQYLNYNRSQKAFYKLGRFTKSIKTFFFTPQASALALISFWAAFVLTYFLLTVAINTVSAYVIFGLIILIHTHITFDAVDALIKESVYQYYS